jgi:hypothetical protein
MFSIANVADIAEKPEIPVSFVATLRTLSG